MAEAAKILDGDVEAPKSKDVAKRKLEAVPAAPAPADSSSHMLEMIDKILRDPSLPMERVNQAFDFYRRLDDATAYKAFNAAVADARAEFVPIVKRNLVSYGTGDKATSYKHESLGDIAEVIDPILARHGLNYRYRGTSNPNEPISVTCIISHRQGYSEETTLRAGADSSGGKNSIQAIGSTVRYLQRYTLTLALGLSTKREDDDGKAADASAADLVTEDQLGKIQAAIVDTGADIPKFLRYFKIARVEDLPAKRFQEAIDLLDAKRKAQI